MVKEIAVFCDVCFTEDVETRAVTLEVVVPGTQQTVTIDLCARHQAELIEPLAKVLLEYGRDMQTQRLVRKSVGRGRARAAGQEGKTCHVCGKTDLIRLDQHIRIHHRDEYFKAFPPDEVLACPECGALFVRAQGLAAHRRVAHPETHRYRGDVDRVTG